MRQTKYFLQLLIFTLLISTVPVLVLGTFSYWKASTSVLDKVTKSTQQLLAQTQITAEQNVKVIEQSLNQLISLPIIHKAFQSPLNESQFQMIQDVDLYMKYTQTKNLGIEELYFVNFRNEWVIYPDRVTPLNEQYYKVYQENIEQFGRYPLLVDNNEYSLYTFNQWDIPYGLIMIKQSPIYSTNPNGLILARIDYSQLNSWIASPEQLGNTYILNNQMQVIGSNVKEPTQYQGIESIATKEILDHVTSEGYAETRYNGNTYYLFYKKSGYTNWTYLSVVPKSQIAKESADIGWLMLYTCLGIILILLFLSYRVSLKMYSPIFRLSKALSNAKGDEHHWDEINFIHNSLANMKQQIISQGKELHKFYVLKLFHGELSLDLEDNIIETHPHINNFEQYAVFIFQIDTLENSSYSNSDWDLLLFNIMNIAEETISEKKRLSLVVINQSLVCLIGLEKDEYSKNRKDLLYFANNTKQNIQDFQGLSVSVGVSRIFTKLQDAKAAFEEGLKSLKYRVRFGNNAVLFFEDVEPTSTNRVIKYPDILSNQIKDAIELNDQQRTEELLKQFINATFDNEGSVTDYQMILIRLLGEIMDVYNVGNDTMILHGQSLPKELLELQTISEIHHWFMKQVIEPIMELIQEKTNQQYKRISDDIIRLVETEKNLEITLEEIGRKLSYSPAYLSQIFRKEKGMSFTDYLTMCRVHVAKKWLLESELTVNEIAKKLNFTNSQNFIRSFKREVGVTPGKYRTSQESKE
ncbi:AraC family transcriptional regulator [Radiobacillus sp. PE A8.2]|uniref:AraC family transcriptional regulator n=1 Tax=Radiobacillus sp. PE A8.2 TaxID=3380349 RepID=UPI00388E6315